MTPLPKIYIFTQIAVLVALFLVLKLGLLAAMLSGLLVYQITDFGSRRLKCLGVRPLLGKSILLLIVASVVIALLGLSTYMLATQVTGNGGTGGLIVLLQRMADVVDKGRTYLPAGIQDYLPANIGEWQEAASAWLRSNARGLSLLGRDVGLFIAHILIGMIIGGMVAISPPSFDDTHGPLARAIGERVAFLSTAFRRIVFSQMRISALNTFLTSLFLVGVLPALIGQDVPLTKVMIAITFVAGLLPVVGNLISNTAICLICLGISPVAAVAALIFLIAVHKLEYFVNARIIGGQIHARAWELLLAMLVMESAFGIPGIVAAPVYYAYIKDELTARELI